MRRRAAAGWAAGLLLLSACVPGRGPAAAVGSVASTERAAQAVQEKIQAALSSREPQTVSLTSEEMTSLLERTVVHRPEAQDDRFRLRRLAARFQGTRASLLIGLEEPVALDVWVEGRLESRGGVLQVDLTGGRMGPLPVPGLLLERVERALNERLARSELPQPIAAVEIRDSRLHLTLKGAAALAEEAIDPGVALEPRSLPQVGLTLALPADHRLEPTPGRVRILMAGGHAWLEVQSHPRAGPDPAEHLNAYLAQLRDEGGWELLRGPFALDLSGRRALGLELAFQRSGQSGDVLYLVVALEERLVTFGGGPAALSSRANRRLLERVLSTVRFD